MTDFPVSAPAAPIIVSALFGRDDFAWLDGLRRAHFPPDRNQLPAHLTLFHHLPPSIEGELKRRLSEATQRARPPATASGLINLGRGVAIRIEAPELESLRAELADAFAGLLVPQDAAGWRPHVTIQNKVQPTEAKTLLTSLAGDFQPRGIGFTGLAVWRYRGGPWEPISQHMFR
ncbi:hypothetical protein FHS31_000287 [Sphingomonas vulcanisoli]|uniref:2'-5' RNA ligase family protein n=1 Tax=Sphingomonas vulcanisoli TaxID=1658060 RepID=A0ABX0TRA6_9SPHN|nr:2'-5' RNA ligase family protein [Sphingomonas vulcanisoli]NIJ06705.1 hypothetical protein [Sphingomonas vulcanisoli]